jgi:putative tRNA adenosine deaminase-associated protein
VSGARIDAGAPGDDDRDGLWESEDLEDLEPVEIAEPVQIPEVIDPEVVVDDEDDDEDDEPDDDDDDENDEVDFALVAWRIEGDWRVLPVPADEAATWVGFRAAVRAQAGAEVVVGFAGLDETYLVIVRVVGTGIKVLLSDVEAADELDFAADLLDELRITDPALDELLESGDLDDAEDPTPIGDAGLLEDLGMSPDELRDLCTDVDSDPEEMVEEIGDSLGFAAQVVRALDVIDG